MLREKGYFPTVLDYKLVFASCLQPGTSPATLYKQLSSLAQRTHKFRCVNTGRRIGAADGGVHRQLFLGTR